MSPQSCGHLHASSHHVQRIPNTSKQRARPCIQLEALVWAGAGHAHNLRGYQPRDRYGTEDVRGLQLRLRLCGQYNMKVGARRFK